MNEVTMIILLFSTISASVGLILGWKLRSRQVDSLINKLSLATHRETQLVNQFETHFSTFRQKLDASAIQVSSLQSPLQVTKNLNEQIKLQKQSLEKNLEEVNIANTFLKETYTNAISKIKDECTLLTSVVEWSSYIQEIIDNQIFNSLFKRNRPAIKAAEEVKEARASARNWKRQADVFKNRVSLYELEAPWLTDCLEYSVNDLVEGLRQEADFQKSFSSSTDPLHLTKME